MTLRIFAAVLMVASASAGCGHQSTAPTMPSAVPSVPSPTPTPAPAPGDVAAATLAVSSFDVRFAELFGGIYWYRPAMVLTETSGKSAATLQSISFRTYDGTRIDISNDAPAGQGCFLTPQSKVVPRGSSWDLSSVYWYCLDIDSRSDLAGRQISVDVTFTDEDGHAGTVSGTATVKQ